MIATQKQVHCNIDSLKPLRIKEAEHYSLTSLRRKLDTKPAIDK